MITDIKKYREKYPYLDKKYKTDEDLLKDYYSNYSSDIDKEFGSFEKFKSSLIPEDVPTSQARSKIKTDESIEQDIVEIDPDTYSRKKKESQIIENAQRIYCCNGDMSFLYWE